MGVLDHVTTLQGRLVSLRPISREDYPTLFKWRSSFETVHMLNFRRRIATFEEFVRQLEALLPDCMLLLIRRTKDNSPIGYALAHSIDPWDGWLGVGMYVEERFRLRGHGGESALIFVDLLFRNFPVRKIVTEVYEFAPDTKALVETMGAEEVGFMPDHYWHEDRRWGLHHMTLTRERWVEYRERFADILRIQRQMEQPETVALNGSSPGVETPVAGTSASLGGGE